MVTTNQSVTPLGWSRNNSSRDDLIEACVPPLHSTNQNYLQFHFAIIIQIIIDFLYNAPDLNVADDTTSHSKKAGVMKK